MTETKSVINTEGQEVTVPINTPVKTINGVHYLHTQADTDEMAERQIAFEIETVNYNTYHKYKDDRRQAYGAVQDQLDMIHWDKKNNTNLWGQHIDTIKALYPKPGA